ncbi:MAG TPA: metal-dependent hydrolase [Vicinamibacteria bacterium]|nr:metal-dependent hydrolase [Vicinamibacteria bacterium]
MPSPVGHVLAGIALDRLTRKTGGQRRTLVLLLAAVAPDLDLLLRWVDGRNHHQAASHSVGSALLAALLVYGLARWRGWSEPAGLGLAACLGWLSHLGLDYLSLDTHPPIGLMACWPFSTGYFKSPWSLFLDIGRTLEWATVSHDAVAVAWEIVLLAPFLYLARRLRAPR